MTKQLRVGSQKRRVEGGQPKELVGLKQLKIRVVEDSQPKEGVVLKQLEKRVLEEGQPTEGVGLKSKQKSSIYIKETNCSLQ